MILNSIHRSESQEGDGIRQLFSTMHDAMRPFSLFGDGNVAVFQAYRTPRQRPKLEPVFTLTRRAMSTYTNSKRSVSMLNQQPRSSEGCTGYSEITQNGGGS